MRVFSPKVLRVTDNVAETLEPVSFQGRMDELTLEKHIATNPALMGERLLVVGRQLAEFEEDRDRLDVLAIDTGRRDCAHRAQGKRRLPSHRPAGTRLRR